jgi:hypothetical protein
MKTCSRCKQVLPLDDFYVDRKTPDGRGAYCKNCARSVRKAHYADNLEKTRTAMLRYYERKSDDLKLKMREYQREHPDEYRVARHKHRTKRTGAGGSFTVEDIQAIYDQQRGRCVFFDLCGQSLSETFEIDHIVAVILGGTSNLDNIQLLDSTCNLMKATRNNEEFRAYLASSDSTILRGSGARKDDQS